MLDVLESYLATASTPELLQSIEQAHKEFDRIGLQDYESAYEEALMVNDSLDIGATTVAIVDITTKFQTKVLEEHGLRLNSHADLDARTMFIRALQDIQEYESKGEILAAAQVDGDSIDVLAEIFSLVCERTADELVVDIAFVSQFLIKRIVELSSVAADNTVEQEELSKKTALIQHALKFFNFLKGPELAAVEMLRSGIDAGFPFIIYANIVGRKFEAMEPLEAAQNLIFLALISSDGAETVRQVIKDHIERYVSSIDHLTRIDIAINDLLLRFQQYEQA